MRLRMIRAEQHREAQHGDRVIEARAVQVQQPHVEKQLPIAQAQFDRLLIVGELCAVVSRHTVRKTQMIISEGIVRLRLDYYLMTPNSLLVVLHSQVVIRERITYLVRGLRAASLGTQA